MLIPLILSAAIAAQPQSSTLNDGGRIADLRTLAIPIRSIDPAHDDFSDLAPLKQAIGDARVVQLGEQSHGDGAVFLAKCRLVKFLHQEMGFDVLVWESGMFDCRIADRELRNPDRPLIDAASEGIFTIWNRSAQVKPVLEYVRSTAATDRPLETAGYDCQISSGKVDRWVDAMATFIAPLGEDHASSKLIGTLRTNKDALMLKADQPVIAGVMEDLEQLGTLVDESRGALVEAHGESEFEFLRRTIDDAHWTARSNLAYHFGDPKDRERSARDVRMGENLVWLANERYRGRKLIVWCATFHAVHDAPALDMINNPGFYDTITTAGMGARAALGDALYTIGFEAHEGSIAPHFREPRPLPPSPPGSIGELLAKLDHPFLFLDLRSLPRDHWLRETQVMRPLGYAPMRAIWPDQFDGLFFTHTMFPSRKDQLAPEATPLTAER